MAEIRGLSLGDEPIIAGVACEAFVDEIERGMPAFTEEHFTRRSCRPGIRLIVAEKAGEVVGFMLLTDESVDALAHVLLVAVEVSRRNRGLAERSPAAQSGS